MAQKTEEGTHEAIVPKIPRIQQPTQPQQKNQAIKHSRAYADFIKRYLQHPSTTLQQSIETIQKWFRGRAV